MGGTSTDVSRYAGTLEHVHETTTAGVTIQAPQLGEIPSWNYFKTILKIITLHILF